MTDEIEGTQLMAYCLFIIGILIRYSYYVVSLVSSSDKEGVSNFIIWSNLLIITSILFFLISNDKNLYNPIMLVISALLYEVYLVYRYYNFFNSSTLPSIILFWEFWTGIVYSLVIFILMIISFDNDKIYNYLLYVYILVIIYIAIIYIKDIILRYYIL
jgi:hypothetical protein